VIQDFTTHRPLLFGIAYRMLGRVTDAHDMVQETWLRWQRQNSADVASARAWLVATITRLCIDQLRSARRRREEYYGVWLPEPLVDDAATSPAESTALADSLTMAFMLMLETLSPVERAVFLLREVFDYDYADIARIVEKSEANCRQIVRRAKAQLPRARAAQTTSAPPTDEARRVVQQFLHATLTGEVSDLIALLTADATLYTDGGGRVASAGRPITTADRISRFFVGVRRLASAPLTFRLVEINGRIGALMSANRRLDRAISFELDGDRVRAIYIVRNPDKLRHLSASPLPAAAHA
jgi:RNA polymerase sigma-70 factor (ECF subfamily)